MNTTLHDTDAKPTPAGTGSDRVRSVLLVEDDRVTLEMLRMVLEDAGYSVNTAENVADLRRILSVDTVDLALVDLTLPDGDALDALLELPAEARPPILCMSSHDAADVRVGALRRGADDFLVKPVAESELVERLAKLLPSVPGSPAGGAAQASTGVLSCSGWVLDPAAQRVTSPQGDDAGLTTGEFRLLLCLVRNPGRPLSREWLTETVIGRAWRAEDRSIDVMVGRLRRKMDLQDDSPLRISSVRYLGYRLDMDS